MSQTRWSMCTGMMARSWDVIALDVDRIDHQALVDVDEHRRRRRRAAQGRRHPL